MVREPAIVTEVRVEEGIPARPVRPARSGPDGSVSTDLVETDLLIEDVSIDGMCGVY